MILLIAIMAAQAMPPSLEPATRVEMEEVVGRYLAMPFALSVDGEGKLSCRPAAQFGSATLTIQTCIAAAQCAEKRGISQAKLVACTAKRMRSWAAGYRRDWLLEHPE